MNKMNFGNTAPAPVMLRKGATIGQINGSWNMAPPEGAPTLLFAGMAILFLGIIVATDWDGFKKMFR